MLMLEEAGAETLGTVAATVKCSGGEFIGQIDGLVKLGLIRKDGDDLVITEHGKKAIRM